jgi:hypothetical protein
MNKFIEKFSTGIKGVLCGLDRLVLRGSLRQVRHVPGMMSYLWEKKILLKEFGGHVAQISEQVKDASLKVAREQKRPIQYLASSRMSKEAVAREIAARDGIREGLVCVLSSVEPCMSFEVHRNAQIKKLESVASASVCIFISIGCTRAGGSCRDGSRPGSPFPSRFVSMDENGWPGRWTKPESATANMTTVSAGLRITSGPRL